MGGPSAPQIRRGTEPDPDGVPIPLMPTAPTARAPIGIELVHHHPSNADAAGKEDETVKDPPREAREAEERPPAEASPLSHEEQEQLARQEAEAARAAGGRFLERTNSDELDDVLQGQGLRGDRTQNNRTLSLRRNHKCGGGERDITNSRGMRKLQ